MKEKKYKIYIKIMSIEIEDASDINGRYLMLIHILLNMVIVIHAMYR